MIVSSGVGRCGVVGRWCAWSGMVSDDDIVMIGCRRRLVVGKKHFGVLFLRGWELAAGCWERKKRRGRWRPRRILFIL